MDIVRGATIHATFQRDFFTSYVSSYFGIVKLDNSDIEEISSKEDAQLKAENGSKLIIKSAKHIEGMKLNIISVGKLEGYSSRSLSRKA